MFADVLITEMFFASSYLPVTIALYTERQAYESLADYFMERERAFVLRLVLIYTIIMLDSRIM